MVSLPRRNITKQRSFSIIRHREFILGCADACFNESAMASLLAESDTNPISHLALEFQASDTILVRNLKVYLSILDILEYHEIACGVDHTVFNTMLAGGKIAYQLLSSQSDLLAMLPQIKASIDMLISSAPRLAAKSLVTPATALMGLNDEVNDIIDHAIFGLSETDTEKEKTKATRALFVALIKTIAEENKIDMFEIQAADSAEMINTKNFLRHLHRIVDIMSVAERIPVEERENSVSASIKFNWVLIPQLMVLSDYLICLPTVEKNKIIMDEKLFTIFVEIIHYLEMLEEQNQLKEGLFSGFFTEKIKSYFGEEVEIILACYKFALIQKNIQDWQSTIDLYTQYAAIPLQDIPVTDLKKLKVYVQFLDVSRDDRVTYEQYLDEAIYQRTSYEDVISPVIIHTSFVNRYFEWIGDCLGLTIHSVMVDAAIKLSHKLQAERAALKRQTQRMGSMSMLDAMGSTWIDIKRILTADMTHQYQKNNKKNILHDQDKKWDITTLCCQVRTLLFHCLEKCFDPVAVARFKDATGHWIVDRAIPLANDKTKVLYHIRVIINFCNHIDSWRKGYIATLPIVGAYLSKIPAVSGLLLHEGQSIFDSLRWIYLHVLEDDTYDIWGALQDQTKLKSHLASLAKYYFGYDLQKNNLIADTLPAVSAIAEAVVGVKEGDSYAVIFEKKKIATHLINFSEHMVRSVTAFNKLWDALSVLPQGLVYYRSATKNKRRRYSATDNLANSGNIVRGALGMFHVAGNRAYVIDLIMKITDFFHTSKINHHGQTNVRIRSAKEVANYLFNHPINMSVIAAKLADSRTMLAPILELLKNVILLLDDQEMFVAQSLIDLLISCAHFYCDTKEQAQIYLGEFFAIRDRAKKAHQQQHTVTQAPLLQTTAQSALLATTAPAPLPKPTSFIEELKQKLALLYQALTALYVYLTQLLQGVWSKIATRRPDVPVRATMVQRAC